MSLPRAAPWLLPQALPGALWRPWPPHLLLSQETMGDVLGTFLPTLPSGCFGFSRETPQHPPAAVTCHRYLGGCPCLLSPRTALRGTLFSS